MNTVSEYAQVIAQTKAMVDDPTVGELAVQHGLQVLNVTWEEDSAYSETWP